MPQPFTGGNATASKHIRTTVEKFMFGFCVGWVLVKNAHSCGLFILLRYLPTKLREGNVFTGVCHSVQRVWGEGLVPPPIHGPGIQGDYWDTTLASGRYASYWNAFLLRPTNKVWVKEIFSQVCVILFIGGRGWGWSLYHATSCLAAWSHSLRGGGGWGSLSGRSLSRGVSVRETPKTEKPPIW